jgi:hypothetical protein
MARMSPKLVDYGCLLQGESSSESGEPRFDGRTARSCRVTSGTVCMYVCTYLHSAARHRDTGQGDRGCFQGSKTSSLKCGALCGRVGTGGPWPDSKNGHLEHAIAESSLHLKQTASFLCISTATFPFDKLEIGIQFWKMEPHNILKHMYKQTRATQIQLL